MFVGKREDELDQDALGLEKRRQLYIGKKFAAEPVEEDTSDLEEAKRSHMFVGKRSAEVRQPADAARSSQ